MDDESSPDVEIETKDENKDEKSISSDLIRGHINTIILRALYDGDKYGYEIMAEIERKSHGQYSIKEPSLYSALKRLEKNGYVTSYWGGSVAGGRRKYFSLTDEGKAVSEQNQSEWEYSRTVIDSLISDKDFDFNNPAPTAVDMRVLRSSTSRVPSREGEDDELDYEPVFDDSAERVRLAEEFEQKTSDLAAEYEQKNTALEEEFQAKSAALEEERKALEEERQNFETEMKMRGDAIEAEQAWREEEITAREQALAAERERLEAMRSEQIVSANAEQAQKAADLAEEAARLEERKRAMDEEEAARRAALEAEESERRRILDEETEARRALLEAEEAEKKRAYEAEEAAKKTSLAAEEAERKRILDEEEAARRRIIEEREQQFAEREAFYNRERTRFSELLRQRDEQINAERRAHAQELAEQERRIVQEQEAIFRQREQQILHKNYLDLVNSPSRPEPEPAAYFTAPEQPSEDAAAPQKYRTVVQNIYAGAVQGERTGEPAPRARSLDGIDFHDLESRAAHDGIKVTTTGGQLPAKAESDVVNTVHKGKMLFLSAIVLLFVCIVEGAIVMAVRKRYALPVFYPYIMWAIGIVVLLVTGLAYANRYGARSIRRNGPAVINAVVGYCLSIVIVFIVALSARIDFASTSDLATFIVVPIVYLFGIVVFGVCYYILTRPKKKQ